MNFKNIFENKLVQFVLVVLFMLLILRRFPIGFIPSVYWVELVYQPALITSYIIAAVSTIGCYYLMFVWYPKKIRDKFIGPFQPYVLHTTERHGLWAYIFGPLIMGPLLGFLFYFIPIFLFPLAVSTLSFSKTEMIMEVESRNPNGRNCGRGVELKHLHGLSICNISRTTHRKMGRGTKIKINGYGGKFGVFYTKFEILNND